MAALILLGASPFSSSSPLLSSVRYQPQSSSFMGGISIRYAGNPSLISTGASPARGMTIVAETKKAVAVLKGNSQVEGVVTLLQENDEVRLELRVSFGDTTSSCWPLP